MSPTKKEDNYRYENKQGVTGSKAISNYVKIKPKLKLM